MKRRYCKYCGKYSAKRKVCLSCKEEQPFQARQKGQKPFQRVIKLKKKEQEKIK